MWLAASPGATEVLVPLAAAFITATGAVIASWLVIRNNRTRGEGAAKRRAEKARKRATHSDRLGRLEAWREQYADPMLHRVQNVFEWDDPKDDTCDE